jgi:hypothetical protein
MDGMVARLTALQCLGQGVGVLDAQRAAGCKLRVP